LSAANLGLFALLTLLGTLLVIQAGWSDGAWWVAGVYAAASTVLALMAWVSLGLRSRLWLPLGRALALFVPGLLALMAVLVPESDWQDSMWPLWSVLPLLLLYSVWVMAARLIPLPEMRRIIGALRG